MWSVGKAGSVCVIYEENQEVLWSMLFGSRRQGDELTLVGGS